MLSVDLILFKKKIIHAVFLCLSKETTRERIYAGRLSSSSGSTGDLLSKAGTNPGNSFHIYHFTLKSARRATRMAVGILVLARC